MMTFFVWCRDRHPHLQEYEILLEIISRGSQSFCPAGDDEHVWTQDSVLLQKFIYCQPDALVETGEDSGVVDIRLGRRVEMESFLHFDSYNLTIRNRPQSFRWFHPLCPVASKSSLPLSPSPPATSSLQFQNIR